MLRSEGNIFNIDTLSFQNQGKYNSIKSKITSIFVCKMYIVNNTIITFIFLNFYHT